MNKIWQLTLFRGRVAHVVFSSYEKLEESIAHTNKKNLDKPETTIEKPISSSNWFLYRKGIVIGMASPIDLCDSSPVNFEDYGV